MMSRWFHVLVAASCGLWVTAAWGQEKQSKQPPNQPSQESICNDIPWHSLDIILGRPTPTSMSISVLCEKDTTGQIVYGTRSGHLSESTPNRAFKGGEPANVVLSELQPNTCYFYQFRGAQTTSPEYEFHTARPPGSDFTFTITADSHLDTNTDPAIYQQTLANALAARPDFHIDLGDTFMSEKHASRERAARQYLAQRYYFGELCHSAPIFLALGNHDGENPRGRDDGPESLAVWSNLQRKKYFPNPVPDSFYTGNNTPHSHAGLLEDYFAWEWGDALFVVLDPFWFGQRQHGQDDNWARTLGAEQYQWLKQTLEKSCARFKFVFIHHLVAPANNQSRGGVEEAQHGEWGGKNADGTDGCSEHRPGWTAPIHDLLVKNKCSVVFHGHDHLYAKQDLDGIVYQEVPQPGSKGNGKLPRSGPEYGYKSGTLLGGPGFIRVNVKPDQATIQYLQTAQDKPPILLHSYAIPSSADSRP